MSIKKNGKTFVRADLHNHLKTGSIFPEGHVRDTVVRTKEMLGSDAIIGLVNAEDRRFERFSFQDPWGDSSREFIDDRDAWLYFPGHDVHIIKGQEVFTREGEVLAFGLPYGKNLRSGRTIRDTITEAKEKYNSILVAPHPFFRGGLGNYLNHDDIARNQLDAIEIWNSNAVVFPWMHANESAMSAYKDWRSAERRKIPMEGKILGALASTDGHSIGEIGSSYTFLRRPVGENGALLVNSTSSSELDPWEALRNSIRRSRSSSAFEKGTSYIGALGHMASLAGYIVKEKVFGRNI